GGLFFLGALHFGELLGDVGFFERFGFGDFFGGGGQAQRLGLALAAAGGGIGDLDSGEVFPLHGQRVRLRDLDALFLIGLGGADVAVALLLADFDLGFVDGAGGGFAAEGVDVT